MGSPAFLSTSFPLTLPCYRLFSWIAIDTVKGLNIIHFNIRSLIPKIDLIRVWVSQHKPDVLTVSETWLHSKISDNEIKLDDYLSSYRADRGQEAWLFMFLHNLSLKTLLLKYSHHFLLSNKEIGRRAFKFKAPSHWNNFLINMRTLNSFHLFKNCYLFLKPHVVVSNSNAFLHF